MSPIAFSNWAHPSFSLLCLLGYEVVEEVAKFTSPWLRFQASQTMGVLRLKPDALDFTTNHEISPAGPRESKVHIQVCGCARSCNDGFFRATRAEAVEGALGRVLREISNWLQYRQFAESVHDTRFKGKDACPSEPRTCCSVVLFHSTISCVLAETLNPKP